MFKKGQMDASIYGQELAAEIRLIYLFMLYEGTLQFYNLVTKEKNDA